jgi:hypothetical protein
MLLAVLLMLGTAEGVSNAATTRVSAAGAMREPSSQGAVRFSLMPAPPASVRAFSLVPPAAERAYVGIGASRPVVGTSVVKCAVRVLMVSPTIDRRMAGPSRGARVDPNILGDISPCAH